MIKHVLLITIIFLFIILLVYSLYEGPFTRHFCTLYKEDGVNKYANLIKKLNSRDVCLSQIDNDFDKYIYWKNELIGAIKDNILVFKGSDTTKDILYDFTTSPYALHRGRTISNIQLIYTNIKDELKALLSLHKINIITGWSLGSVLACITALDNYNTTDIERVVLFGFPNIFSDRFKERYNKALGDKTIIYNHNLDIFANIFGYGKLIGQIDTVRWKNAPLKDIYKLFTNGLGFFHMSYFQ